MWFKVLSLMIFCLLSMGAHASPFGHTSGLNSEGPLFSFGQASTKLHSQAFLDTDCRESRTIPSRLECCHIDTCSALILDLDKSLALPFLADRHSLFIHWPDTPLSRLIRPPKVSFV